MATVQETLNQLQGIAGFIGAALVDTDSGMAAGTIGGNANFDINVAAATNCDVYKAKRRAISELKLTDKVNDMLITLDTQYHLICPVPHHAALFYYVAVDRAQANLAMTRIKLQDAAKSVEI